MNERACAPGECDTISYHMGEQLNRIMRDALKAVTASVREIAKEARVSRITLARHASKAMGVSPDVARKVAGVLRRRGERLLALAKRLKRAALEEEE